MDVRPTDDVDFVIHGSYSRWAKFQAELRDRGFRDVPDVHVSKMVKDGLVLDIMPDDEPSMLPNQWYVPVDLTDPAGDVAVERHELLSQIVGQPNGLFIIQAHLCGDDASQAAETLLRWMSSLKTS